MTTIGGLPSPVLAEQGMTCTFPIKRGLWSALLLLTLPVTAAEPEPMRIQQLQR